MNPLISQNLCIRPFRNSDGPAFVAAIHESLSTVGAWMSWCRPGFALEHAEAWFDNCDRNLMEGTAFDLGMFSEDGSELLGGIAVNQINRRQNFANIGYWVRESRQRRGIATRAVKAIATYGFDHLGFTRLEIVAPEKNVASRGVAEKVGAVFECVARNRVVVFGRPEAAAVYSLIPGQVTS